MVIYNLSTLRRNFCTSDGISTRSQGFGQTNETLEDHAVLVLKGKAGLSTEFHYEIPLSFWGEERR
jgi:hypothetical protein